MNYLKTKRSLYRSKASEFRKNKTQNIYVVSKTLYSLLIALLISMASFAQSATGFNYKALIKDANGNVLENQTIVMKFTILLSGSGLDEIYKETHMPTTDANGIVTLNIGEGNTSLGVFENLDWDLGDYSLKTEIDIEQDGSFVALPEESYFKSVPFAKLADKAKNVSGLEKITLNGKTGWRLVGRNPSFYGPIGSNAVDLSISNSTSELYGATGNNSIAMGYLTTASSYLETAIGRFNTQYTPTSTTSWNSEDRLFVIGNGLSNSHNAMTVLKNGKTGINTSTPSSIFEVLHQDGRPTSGDRTNAFGIRNYATLKSWQFYTHSTGYLELFSDGEHKGSFNPTSGVYATVSDRRLKKDIIPLDNGTLIKVMQLNPVSYLMNDQTDTNRNLGLISQEVQEIFPSITHYVEECDLLTLSYTELIPILIKAIQEQQAVIKEQNSKLTNQDSKIETLTAEINQFKTLDQRVNQLELLIKLSQQ